jgi:glucose/arabinose dehydrogenase
LKQEYAMKKLNIALCTFLVPALLASLCGCAVAADPPTAAATVGPNPTLPEPDKSLVPVVKVAPAKGWPAGQTPVAAAGMKVTPLASGLDHPRWVYVLPNGDVLVAETNRPPKPPGFKSDDGLKGWIKGKMMSKAGAGTPSANRITLLRDADGDGIAEVRTTFLEGLNSPFGMALVGSDFYVANTDALVHYIYREGDTRINGAPTKIVDLPGGPRNHHWTKNLIANQDGSKLYVTVGSNSNVAEHGMQEEAGRAAIWEIDPKTRTHRIFASGLRNPNGLAWDASSGKLWTVVNERDELGNDLVPDYLTSVSDGAFYGWPYSYFGANVDVRVKPPRPDLVAKAVSPDYALGAHVAALGLARSEGGAMPSQFANGMFIGEHGSWNRKPFSGYKVVFVPFENGKPAGKPLDVLTGFLNEKEEALGRPVGVAIDKRGSLLVADDVGNVVWRVAPQSQVVGSTR